MHDEVRLGFRHGAQVRNVMAHDHIAQCEVSSGAEGQVADNEPHWWGQAGCQKPYLLSDNHPSRHPVPTIVSPGVPRCSWTTSRSVTPLALQARTSAPTSCRPRFMR